MKANFLGMAAALALVSCCAVETAQASPIDVSYSVSGSPGEWLLDFTVTNNLDQCRGTRSTHLSLCRRAAID